MNDDITSRETELVNAILYGLRKTLDEYRLGLSHDNTDEWLACYQHGCKEGYRMAQEVVGSVLSRRGFDVKRSES